MESFSDAITLQPDDAEAWHQRAIARYHAGDITGAIHDLQQTVTLEPRDFAAFRTLADISAAREDWKGAYAAWQKVLELDPKTAGRRRSAEGSEEARVRRGYLSLRPGSFETALAIVEECAGS